VSPGRPRKRPEDRRVVKRDIRFTEAEYDRLCLTALKMRMDVSEFIRLMVLPDRPATPELMPFQKYVF